MGMGSFDEEEHARREENKHPENSGKAYDTAESGYEGCVEHELPGEVEEMIDQFQDIQEN